MLRFALSDQPFGFSACDDIGNFQTPGHGDPGCNVSLGQAGEY
jgi:hypothetical protein